MQYTWIYSEIEWIYSFGSSEFYYTILNPAWIFFASLSPKNFFKIKKQNLEKNRVEKEEKLFRKRFEVCSPLKVKTNNKSNFFYKDPIREQHLCLSGRNDHFNICSLSPDMFLYYHAFVRAISFARKNR